MFKYLPRKPSVADRVKNRRKRSQHAKDVLVLKGVVSELLRATATDAQKNDAAAWKRLASSLFQLWTMSFDPTVFPELAPSTEKAMQFSSNSGDPSFCVASAVALSAAAGLDSCHRLIAGLWESNMQHHALMPRVLMIGVGVCRRLRLYEQAEEYLVRLLGLPFKHEFSDHVLFAELAFTYEQHASWLQAGSPSADSSMGGWVPATLQHTLDSRSAGGGAVGSVGTGAGGDSDDEPAAEALRASLEAAGAATKADQLKRLAMDAWGVTAAPSLRLVRDPALEFFARFLAGSVAGSNASSLAGSRRASSQLGAGAGAGAGGGGRTNTRVEPGGLNVGVTQAAVIQQRNSMPAWIKRAVTLYDAQCFVLAEGVLIKGIKAGALGCDFRFAAYAVETFIDELPLPERDVTIGRPPLWVLMHIATGDGLSTVNEFALDIVTKFIVYWHAKRERKKKVAAKNAFEAALRKARLKALVRVPDLIQTSLDEYRERSRAKKMDMIMKMRHHAATLIEALFRGHHARLRVAKLRHDRYLGALKMQGSFRVFKARQIAKTERLRRAEETRRDRERWAAVVRSSLTILQRNGRMWPKRDRLGRVKRAVLVLQCFTRRFLARVRLFYLRERRRVAEEALTYRCFTVRAVPAFTRGADGRRIYTLRRPKRLTRKARRTELEGVAFAAAVAEHRRALQQQGQSHAQLGGAALAASAASAASAGGVVGSDGAAVGGSGDTPGLAHTLGRSALPPLLPVSPRTQRLRRLARDREKQGSGGGSSGGVGGGGVGGSPLDEVPDVLYGNGVLGALATRKSTLVNRYGLPVGVVPSVEAREHLRARLAGRYPKAFDEATTRAAVEGRLDAKASMEHHRSQQREAKVQYYIEKQATVDADVAALSGLPVAPNPAAAAAAAAAAAKASSTAAATQAHSPLEQGGSRVDVGAGGTVGNEDGDNHDDGHQKGGSDGDGGDGREVAVDADPSVPSSTAPSHLPSSTATTTTSTPPSSAASGGADGGGGDDDDDDGDDDGGGGGGALPPHPNHHVPSSTAPTPVPPTAALPTMNIWARPDVLAATGLPVGRPSSLLGPSPLALLTPLIAQLTAGVSSSDSDDNGGGKGDVHGYGYGSGSGSKLRRRRRRGGVRQRGPLVGRPRRAGRGRGRGRGRSVPGSSRGGGNRRRQRKQPRRRRPQQQPRQAGGVVGVYTAPVLPTGNASGTPTTKASRRVRRHGGGGDGGEAGLTRPVPGMHNTKTKKKTGATQARHGRRNDRNTGSRSCGHAGRNGLPTLPSTAPGLMEGHGRRRSGGGAGGDGGLPTPGGHVVSEQQSSLPQLLLRRGNAATDCQSLQGLHEHDGAFQQAWPAPAASTTQQGRRHGGHGDAAGGATRGAPTGVGDLAFPPGGFGFTAPAKPGGSLQPLRMPPRPPSPLVLSSSSSSATPGADTAGARLAKGKGQGQRNRRVAGRNVGGGGARNVQLSGSKLRALLGLPKKPPWVAEAERLEKLANKKPAPVWKPVESESDSDSTVETMSGSGSDFESYSLLEAGAMEFDVTIVTTAAQAELDAERKQQEQQEQQRREEEDEEEEQAKQQRQQREAEASSEAAGASPHKKKNRRKTAGAKRVGDGTQHTTQRRRQRGRGDGNGTTRSSRVKKKKQAKPPRLQVHTSAASTRTPGAAASSRAAHNNPGAHPPPSPLHDTLAPSPLWSTPQQQLEHHRRQRQQQRQSQLAPHTPQYAAGGGAGGAGGAAPPVLGLQFTHTADREDYKEAAAAYASAYAEVAGTVGRLEQAQRDKELAEPFLRVLRDAHDGPGTDDWRPAWWQRRRFDFEADGEAGEEGGVREHPRSRLAHEATDVEYDDSDWGSVSDASSGSNSGDDSSVNAGRA